jgi:Tfp pilus assembly protein FimT
VKTAQNRSDSRKNDDANWRPPPDVARMRGTTLTELLITITMLGVLAGIAAPRGLGFRHRTEVQKHTGTLRLGWREARQAALLAAAPAVLHVTPERLAVYVLRSPGDSTLWWERRGPASDGVRLLAGVPRVVFAPNGLTMGVANGRYELSRGGFSRTLVAARLGRLRVARPRHAGSLRAPGPARSPGRSGGPSG